MSQPPDGAAAERTALAWTRTVVALLVGLPLCLLLLLLARRRRGGTHAAVAGRGAPPDAMLPVGTAAVVTLLAAVELAHLLLP